MAVRLLPDGTYEFDTVAEAAEFRNLSTHGEKQSEDTPTKKRGDRPGLELPSEPRFQPFFRSLSDAQMMIVYAMVNADQRLTTEGLAEASELQPTKIGPTLRHLRDRATKYGIGSDFIATVKVPSRNGGRAAAQYEMNASAKEQLKKIIPRRKDG